MRSSQLMRGLGQHFLSGFCGQGQGGRGCGGFKGPAFPSSNPGCDLKLFLSSLRKI